jgi:hypothetical protein
MFIKSLLISKNMLNANLIGKLSPWQLFEVVNTKNLHGFFQKFGITHHVSCTYVHQQIYYANFKHCHIVEVGLALLAHASMPLKF